jgi:ethanolamine-phosphate cytidylyltransferase
MRSCKFVDEVVPDVPYVMNAEYIRYLLTDLKIDYIVHGDDPCIVDGKDVYEEAKRTGKGRVSALIATPPTKLRAYCYKYLL